MASAWLASTRAVTVSMNSPCTELLDVIFTRNVAAERSKNKLLLVETAAELVKLITHRNVLVKFFLGSVQ